MLRPRGEGATAPLTLPIYLLATPLSPWLNRGLHNTLMFLVFICTASRLVELRHHWENTGDERLRVSSTVDSRRGTFDVESFASQNIPTPQWGAHE